MVDGIAKKLYVLPKSVRKYVCVKNHDFGGHYGVERTVAKVLQRFWFSGMRRYVRQHIRGCARCLMAKIPGGKKQGKLNPLAVPPRPFYRIDIDHCGPFIESRASARKLVRTARGRRANAVRKTVCGEVDKNTAEH